MEGLIKNTPDFLEISSETNAMRQSCAGSFAFVGSNDEHDAARLLRAHQADGLFSGSALTALME